MSLLVEAQVPRILLVDDEAANLKLLRQVLGDDYRLSFARSGAAALDLVANEDIDLILLDIMMPEMTGYDVSSALKADSRTATIPVIFVTAMSDTIDEEKGFQAGAVDYITKPITPSIVKARVGAHLSLIKAEALQATQIELIQKLGRAAEYRDNETGMHVQRMSHYSYILAKAAGVQEALAFELLMAAPMHDIGKIGIPDHILLKPGPLTHEEFETMKTHTRIGATILESPSSNLIALARSIALYHHEKWDGSGYPEGLKGEDIPLEVRIVAIADVFDALTSERPYKQAWPLEEALAHLDAQSGKHFDPELVSLFKQHLPEIIEVRSRFSDKLATSLEIPATDREAVRVTV